MEVVFDRSDLHDNCETPLEVGDMAAVVNGPVEIASRQEWGIAYTFEP